MTFPVPGPGGGFPGLPFHFREELAASPSVPAAADLPGAYANGPVSYAASMQTGRVAYVEQVARDEVLMTFAQPMIVSLALRSPSSYVVTAITAGADPVVVKDVLVQGDVPTVNRLWLVVSRPLEGSLYTVAAAEMLVTGGGSVLHPNHLSARFKSRVTKVDAYLARPLLSKSTRSTVRSVYEAALRQLDIVGGSRNDREPHGDES